MPSGTDPNLLSAFVADSEDGLLALDRELRYVFWNPGMERLFGMRADQVLGRPARSVFPFLADSGEEELYRRALAGESLRARNRRFVTLGPRGEERHGRYDARFTPWRSGGGGGAGGSEIVGVVGTIRDVTQLEADLRQAVRARDEFFSLASHELCTPLTSLQLQLEAITRALRRDPEQALQSGKLARRANAAATQAERMGMLLDVMLDVSRIAGGRLPLEYEDSDAAAIARAVATRMAAPAAEAGSTVEIQAAAREAGRWDPLRLEQVLANLLSNAIKYGGGRPITLTLGGDAARLSIAVRDQGIGIAPEQQARIFERFERAVSAHNYGGFGLGLWICRRIVDAMEGEISVESAPGRGATFTVMLPRQPDRAATAATSANTSVGL
jgi:PAS domain S-box-containing protein